MMSCLRVVTSPRVVRPRAARRDVGAGAGFRRRPLVPGQGPVHGVPWQRVDQGAVAPRRGDKQRGEGEEEQKQ